MERFTRRSVISSGLSVALGGYSAVNPGEPPTNRGSRTEPPSSDGRDSRDSGSPRSATTDDQRSSLPPVDIRGAIYVPARAFNIYQMWDDYDREEIERDFGYAGRVNLNAIRTWVNYEYWKQEPGACAAKLEHLLSTAADEGLRVLLILFEGIGGAPTRDNLTDTDPRTAMSIASPGPSVIKNRRRWDEPRRFVNWVMDRHGDDERLLGIEVMNEPGWFKNKPAFTHSMLKTLNRHRGSVPLTVGSTSMINNIEYYDEGCEILQFHYNFPINASEFTDALRQIAIVDRSTAAPVWLTEWQRIRSGRGAHAAPAEDELVPNYASMAPHIHAAGFGNFFWSLMVKPAFNRSQRHKGVLNGLFHEDGAVWSLDDARAIKAMSGDSEFHGEQRQKWPEWAEAVKNG
ncbi:glycoside hydrolase 5 family protein [Halorussus salinisoli]|uniref:glycoside hydrolase n=1 Tax=Halorussus salinisoli TaxID=2558242 RepID=UPI002A90D79E|nr:glycoside hydrolase [Halorussus salinisoli]